MAMTYAYNFAEIDPETNMCVGVMSTSNPAQGNEPNWVEIPVNDEDYICKYYNWKQKPIKHLAPIVGTLLCLY